MAAGEEGGQARQIDRASEPAVAARRRKPQGWKCMPFIIGSVQYPHQLCSLSLWGRAWSERLIRRITLFYTVGKTHLLFCTHNMLDKDNTGIPTRIIHLMNSVYCSL
jgi:hypothetical protein